MKPFPALWVIVVLACTTVACGDDDNGSDIGQSGGALSLQGDVVDYDDPGEDREISLGTYFSATQESASFGQGRLTASGAFSFTFEDNDYSPGYEPVANYFNRLCEASTPTLTLSDDDAGMLVRPVLRFETELLSGESALSAVALASSQETAGRAQGELYPRRQGDTLAIWVSADRAVDIQGHCIIANLSSRDEQTTFDLSLQRGWNEIIVESISGSGTPAELSLTTRARPAELEWRFYMAGQ